MDSLREQPDGDPYPLGTMNELPLVDCKFTVLQLNCQGPLHDKEELIFVLVAVPDETRP